MGVATRACALRTSTAASSAGPRSRNACDGRTPSVLEPGKYTVVLEAAAAGDLVERIGVSIRGPRQPKKAAPS